MNTNLISKEDNIAKFTVVFTADEFEDAIVDAYKRTRISSQSTVSARVKLQESSRATMEMTYSTMRLLTACSTRHILKQWLNSI